MAEVASMTGYADASRSTEAGVLTVELRSVNARFLEVALRIPDELRFAEPLLRERIAAAVARGKLDCRINLVRETLAGSARINDHLLAQLAGLARRVRDALPEAAPIGVADLLRWPGVLESPGADPQAWREPLLDAAAEALQGLARARAREGAALRAALLERCGGIEQIIEQLRALVPRLLAEMERRLHERLGQALGNALSGSTISRDELNDRIRQELTLNGMRADVAEELDRLAAHVAEVRRVLAQGGGVGRRLDFLLQELNREANTIASKAGAIEMTTAAVDLKLLVEQMREQVQNLE